MLRNARLFLEDIEKSCAKIILYTRGLTRDQVLTDELRLDGILFNLQIIGEAVKRLPEDLRDRHPNVAWREIAGLRDFVAHAYFALDLRAARLFARREAGGLLRSSGMRSSRAYPS